MKLNSKFEILKSALSKIYHKVQHSLYFTSVCLTLLIPLTIIANSISTVHYCPLSTHQTKLPTYNLPLSTNQDTCPTGHESDIFYFAAPKVLNFKSGQMQIDSGYIPETSEAVNAICDRNGDLLFYMDNTNLFDKSHKNMKGSNTNNFWYGSSAMNLILPLPDSDSIYYIFTPEWDNNLNNKLNPTQMHYHIVNMNRNNGLGELVTAKQFLLDSTSERVAAVKHCNGKDWWVVGQNAYTEQFAVWLLSDTGVSKKPLHYYSSGNISKNDNLGITSYMKFSPDGDFLAETNYDTIGTKRKLFLKLHKFDPSVGRFFQSILIHTPAQLEWYLYGLEFSSSGRYLYLTANDVYQYDLSYWNADSIQLSETYLGRKREFGSPCLGKDGKIYISSDFSPLTVIHNPEKKGSACDIRFQSLDLGHSRVANIRTLGSPSPPRQLLWPYRAAIRGELESCADSVFQYYITDACPHEPVQWTMLDSAQLRTAQGLDTVDIYFPRLGTYRIAAAYPVRCGFKSDTITVDVFDCSCNTRWESTIKDTQLCYLGNITIPYQTNAQYVKINQNYFYPEDSIVIKQIKADTCLDITLSNFFGCDTTFRYCIDVYDRVRSTMDTVRLCYGDSIFIKDRYYSFTDQVVTLYDNMNGCDSMHTTHLRYYSPARSIAQTYTLCNGDSIFINGIWHTKSSNFSYSAKSIYGCDSLIYDVQIKLQSATTPTMYEHYICNGDSIFINNQWIKSAQSIEIKLKSFTGCDSIIMHEIKLYPDIVPTMREHYICNGDSIFINNQWIKSEQSIETKLKSFTGCDSVITHEIKLYPAITPTMSEHYICNGDSIFINNQWIKSEQRIETKLKSFTGCDSIIMHEIKLHPDIASTIREHYICNGDSIFINNQWIKSTQSIETKLRSFTGCDSILQDKIIIKPLFTREIQFYICYGDSVQVFGSWYDEEIQFDQRISSSNPALCDSLIEYQIIQYEDIYVDLPQRIEIEEGSAVTLTSTYSPNAKTFRWSPSQELSCTDCSNPICTSSNDSVYYLEVSDENGCISSDSIQVLVKKKSGEYFFPNAFSPNADGINDLWIPVPSSAQLNLISIHIYSRWGEQVYSCTLSCKGWDGKLNDQAVNPGVYVYHMVFRDERGDRKEVNGEFTLLR
jgi:gliding motility-associated-like protein